jgi:hypothetical protein
MVAAPPRIDRFRSMRGPMSIGTPSPAQPSLDNKLTGECYKNTICRLLQVGSETSGIPTGGPTLQTTLSLRRM